MRMRGMRIAAQAIDYQQIGATKQFDHFAGNFAKVRRVAN